MNASHVYTVLLRRMLVTATSFLVSTAALAQTSTEATPPETKTRAEKSEVVVMDPFLVTTEETDGYGSKETAIGSRSVKAIMDLPTAINIVNRELINDLGATSAADVVQYGVSGAVQNQTITDDMFFRGFRSIQPMRNGVQIPATRRNPMYDIERIEVVKGPSAMLLGNVNYLGGALNFVTRNPTDTVAGDAKVTLGTHNYVRFEANSSGPIIKSDGFKANYRVTVGSEDADPEKIQESVDQKFASAAFSMKYNDRISFDTTVATYVDNGYQYWSDFLDNVKSVAGGPPVLNVNSTRSFSASLGDQVFMDTKWFFVNSSLSAQLSPNGHFNIYYTYTEVNLFEDVMSGSSLLADNVTLTRGFFHFKDLSIDQNLQAQYLYRTLRNSWRNDLQVGVDQSWHKGKNGYAPSAAPDLNTSNPDYTFTPPPWDEATYRNGWENTGNTGSYWVQDNLTLFNDKLILIGGLRWTTSHVYSFDPVSNSGSKSPSPGTTQTHRVGAVYKPIEGISIYVADAQNINPVLGLDDFNKPLKDQAGKLKEIGVKFSVTGDKVDFYGSVDYFDMELTNAYSQEYNEELGRVISIQTAADTSKGFEVDLGSRLKLASGHADIIATYYDAEGYSVATKRRPQEVPERVYSLFGKYTWTSGPLKGLTLGAGVFDQSEKFSGSDPVSGNPYVLDVPATYALMARYELGAWSFQVNGRNVGDDAHIVRIASPALVQTDPGAEYRIATSYKW